MLKKTVETNSTIAPAAIFFNERFTADRPKKGYCGMRNKSSCSFLFAKEYRTMASGWQGASYFRKYCRELVSKQAISLNKSLGGSRGTTLEYVSFVCIVGPDYYGPP